MAKKPTKPKAKAKPAPKSKTTPKPTTKKAVEPKIVARPETADAAVGVPVRPVKNPADVLRSTVGGYPILASDQTPPTCDVCRAPMVLFFQLDLEERFALPFKPGSHLLVFMCPKHNDAATRDMTQPPGKDFITWPERLPAAFWDRYHHYKLFLNLPGQPEKVHALEPHLVYFELLAGSPEFPVGGAPTWIQRAEPHTCACGAEMSFICQLPDQHGFPKVVSAAPQPDSWAREFYCLFLGNACYFFACRAQCDPRAVWVANQN